MQNSLFPGFIVIDYHSTVGQHKMTIPTRAWNPLGGTTGHGGYVAWDSSDRDADEMVIDLVTELCKICSDEVDFDRYTIYTMADVDAFPVPVAGDTCNALTGVDGTPGWFKAVQFTYTFYDTEFKDAKLTLLDASSNGDFSKRLPGALSADEQDVVDEFILVSNAWSSRNGARPSTLRSLTVNLNQKLRREYGLG